MSGLYEKLDDETLKPIEYSAKLAINLRIYKLLWVVVGRLKTSIFSDKGNVKYLKKYNNIVIMKQRVGD
ncbi:MAG: hypothetical protein PHU23_14335 [Dehalococcoidales bacterium]|nr:hypothetical protein [Dehalococcoidales bacterium]